MLKAGPGAFFAAPISFLFRFVIDAAWQHN